MAPKRLNNAGFTLVSVLVAAVIGSITMTAFMSMFKSQVLISKDLNYKSDQQSLVNTVKIVLSNPERCAESLFDRKNRAERARFNPGVVGEEAYELGAVKLGEKSIAEVGLLSQTLITNDLKLREIDPAGREDLGDKSRYIASLTLISKKTGQNIGGEELKHSLSLLVTTQKEASDTLPKDAIVACSLLPEDRAPTSTSSGNLKIVTGNYRSQCPIVGDASDLNQYLQKCSATQTFDLGGTPLFVQVSNRRFANDEQYNGQEWTEAHYEYYKIAGMEGSGGWEAYFVSVRPLQFVFLPDAAAFIIAAKWSAQQNKDHRPYLKFLPNGFQIRGPANGQVYTGWTNPNEGEQMVFDYIAYVK